MTEADVIDIIIDHTKKQFPRVCHCCGQRFETLRDFCASTKPAGSPVVFDLEMGDLSPQNPIGGVAFSNCRCGSSLTLSSKGMPLLQYWALMRWGYNEMNRRHVSQGELLQYLRDKAHEKVVSETGE